MIEPRILVRGEYYPDDLLVSIGESNRKIDPRIEEQIENIWKYKVADAEAKGKTIYNGTTYRLNSLEEVNGKLKLDFGLLKYKDRECLIEARGYYDLSEEFYRKGCFCAAAVKTSDDKFLMVELSGKSMNTNQTDFIGGIMEKPIEYNFGEDVFQSMYDELEEEASIHRDNIEKIYLHTIYLGTKTNVGFYFEVILNKSVEEIKDKFSNDNRDADIKSLKIMTRDEYIGELANHPNSHKKIFVDFLSI